MSAVEPVPESRMPTSDFRSGGVPLSLSVEVTA
jgi:hypothetical protein